VKKTLPNQSLAINFKKLMKAFDMNGNGSIDLPEFVNLMDQAGLSNADTQSYHKIAESITPGTTKRKFAAGVSD
jgi:Ca2+-binding EF-hand superfamily protein